MKSILTLFLMLSFTSTYLNAQVGFNPECNIDTTDFNNWNKTEQYEYEWHCQMSPEERYTVFESYLAGREYGIGLTLAGICWKESRGGRWQIGLDGTGFGLYHIDVKWFLKRNGIDDTPYNRSKWGTIIMLNRQFSEQYVISFIQTLRKRYHDNWYKVWKAYNGSDEYARDMKILIGVLERKVTTGP